MRILCLTRYSRQGASSRYRVYQYLPLLKEMGFECTIHPLFPDSYLRQRYSSRERWRQLLGLLFPLAGRYARRYASLLRRLRDYDAVWLQNEALPYWPFAFEQRLYTSRVPVVVDYDDATYLNYARRTNPLVRAVLESKIPRVVAGSTHVVTGNRHLAEWARVFSQNVTVIPTSIDLDRYPPQLPVSPTDSRPVIVWIGTPVTARYLRRLERPLAALRSRHDFVLKVIGARDFAMDGIKVANVPWSESTEVTDLRSADIGIMPLPDDPWAQGKSALKLIQYLAAGVAAVASPVGANCDVVQDGNNGLLASTEQEWLEKLSLLIESPSLRRQLAGAGRQAVESGYSIQANAPRWARIFYQVATVDE